MADHPAAPLRGNFLIRFPADLGATVLFVDLPGVPDGQVRLSGEVLADIHLGKMIR